MDDIGWIPFEPTPGFGEVRYTPWKIKKGETVISSDFSGNYGVGAWEEYEEEEDLGGDFVDLGVSAEATRNNNIRQMLRILGLSVATVFVIGTLIIFLERLIGRWRYGKMSDTQKYMLEIRKNLRILSRLEIERDAGETLEELKVRMSEYLNQEEEFCFLEDYEEFIYGAGTVDSQMIQHAKEEQEMLLRILKQRKRWAYLYYSIFVNEYRA